MAGFTEKMLEVVRDISTDLAPDEDWSPALFLEGGGPVLIVTPLHHLQTFDAMLGVVRLALRALSPVSAALVFQGAQVEIDPDTDEEMPDGPRAEMLTVFVHDQGELTLWKAEIGRREHEHPVLADWEQLTDDTVEGGLTEMPLGAVLAEEM